jgi:hypothetical protein
MRQLLKEFDKGVGQPKKNWVGARPILTQRQAAADAGLSKRQEKQAERRYAELLKEMYRATPQTANLNGRRGKEPQATEADGSPYAQALQDTGVSPRAASRYQALAEVPQEIFDAALHSPDSMPTARANRPLDLGRLPTDCLQQARKNPTTKLIAGFPLPLRDFLVAWGGIEPPTQGFSILCSTD